MKYNFQTILSLKFDIRNKMKSTSYGYIMALLLTAGRKNCSSMSREAGISRNILYEFLRSADENIESMHKYLFNEARKLCDENDDVVLIVDFTQLLKPYAYKIDSLCYDHNGCSNRVEKGISLGVVALSSAKKRVTIPLDFNVWIQKKYAGDKYIKKNDLAKDFVREANKHFKFKYASFDGAFASKDFLKFLVEVNVKFVMRIPSNRCVSIANKKAQQLRHAPELKLIRNEREKRVEGVYKSMPFFFIGYKRKGKNDEMETVYLVGNMDISAKEYVKSYSPRSLIEGFFRTGKQSLGIGQCQVLSGDKQKAHIFATFVAYVVLEQNKIANQKKCPEDIINILRDKNFTFNDIDPCDTAQS